jgi:hypothetical protein
MDTRGTSRRLFSRELIGYCRLESRLSLLSVVIGICRAQPQAIRCSAFFLLENPKS